MRQNQHNQHNQHSNKRMRGRNRKGPNPLSRSFESNGPDIKIRGNAAHIAEKYTTLARDAQVSGDRVLAESYLQHAEHYNRIIATAQAQSQAQAEQQQQQPGYEGRDNDDADQNEVTPADNTSRPQPDQSGAEQAAREGQPNGTGSEAGSGDDDGDGKPRSGRSRRGRRGPRVKADGDSGTAESAEASGKGDGGDAVAEPLHS